MTAWTWWGLARRCSGALILLGAVAAGPACGIEEMWRMQQTGGLPAYDRGAHVLVAPFTDHNGDGRIDLNDGPDVIVIASIQPTQRGTQVRVLDARTGVDLRRFVNPPIAIDGPERGCVPAIADLDADGFPELIFCEYPGPRTALHAFNWDGTLKWSTRFEVEFATLDHRSITVADLDGDGLGEVLAGKHVVNHDGTLRVVLQVAPCNSSFPLDLDLDGIPQIICGRAAANQDGSVFFPGWGDGDSVPAQLDADPQPELVHFAGDWQRIEIDDDGTEMNVSAVAESVSVPLVPATDLDGDGITDIIIGTVGGLQSWVMARGSANAEIWRWPSPEFFTEAGTLATIDGTLTLLHQNLAGLHALDARTGVERFFIPNPSGTAEEMPIFADIDGDGRGEIILKSTNDPTIGVRVFRDDSWCDARPIWNQSHFVPDWIGDDMRPTYPWATPIDWITVGTRMQQDLCPCAAVGDAVIEVVRTCVNGQSCVRASVTGAAGPLTYTWTLPDGTTTTSVEPCFTHAVPGTISVTVRDANRCPSSGVAPFVPPEPRELTIEVSPTCSVDLVQCARATTTGAPSSVSHAWTLPDGSASSDAEPCFTVVVSTILTLALTDADGCVLLAEHPVQPYLGPPAVELSGMASAVPLLMGREGASVLFTWEPSPAGNDMVLWEGTLGEWAGHQVVACTAAPSARLVPPPGTSQFYLAGERRCDGTPGSLGAASTGSARPVPDVSCP